MKGERLGYWAGGGFCILAILSLSLGIAPILRARLNKPLALQIPGQSSLDIRLAGTYIAVASLSNSSPEDKKKVMNMDYWLSDALEKQYFDVNKFPQKSYYSASEEAQTPLFEIILKKKGKYILTSDYPIGTEGPSVTVVLYHYDWPHVRSEIIAGGVLFLLLGGLGGFLIWKTRRSTAAVIPAKAGI